MITSPPYLSNLNSMDPKIDPPVTKPPKPVYIWLLLGISLIFHTSAGFSTEASSGRASVVGNSLLYGTALYGPGIISLLEPDSPEVGVGLEMLIASGSFLGALQATKQYELDPVRTRLLIWGAYTGTAYGLGSLAFFDSEDTRTWAVPPMLLTPLGTTLVYQLTQNRDCFEGETDLLVTSGLGGLLYGTTIPYLIRPIEDLSSSLQQKIYVSSAMLTVPLFIWQTTQLIDRLDLHHISRGEATLIPLGGIVGGLYGAGTAHLFLHDRYPRLHVLSSMLGLPLGVYSAYRLTLDEDYTVGRATMIGLGAIAGAIFSEGLAFITQAEDSRIFAACGIVGSALGIYLVHNATQSQTGQAKAGSDQPIANAPTLPSGGGLPIQLLTIKF
jgi:hypothetical protein